MNENALIKYNKGELERLGNSIAITNKLIQSFAQYEILVDRPDIPLTIKCSSRLKSVEIRGTAIFLGDIKGDNIINFPLNEWLKDYFQSGNTSVTVNFFLDNYNTRAAHPLLNLFSNFNYLNKSNHLVMINWYYDSDNQYMLEIGEAFSSMTNCKFRLIMTTK